MLAGAPKLNGANCFVGHALACHPSVAWTHSEHMENRATPAQIGSRKSELRSDGKLKHAQQSKTGKIASIHP